MSPQPPKRHGLKETESSLDREGETVNDSLNCVEMLDIQYVLELALFNDFGVI